MLKSTALFLLLCAAAAVLYYRSERVPHDPYGQCKKMPETAKREQCERLVGFSLSAGW